MVAMRLMKGRGLKLTFGGSNKGKVKQSEGDFAKVRVDGKKDYTLPAETGKYAIKGGHASSTKTSKKAEASV
jgi:hypothetical protein